MPSHDLTRFYALLPALTVFAALNQTGAQSLLTALGVITALKQLH